MPSGSMKWVYKPSGSIINEDLKRSSVQKKKNFRSQQGWVLTSTGSLNQGVGKNLHAVKGIDRI